MNNNTENNQYNKNRERNENWYNSIQKTNNSIIKVFAIIIAVISVIAMIYFYKDFGLGVIFIPLVLGFFVLVAYLKQRVSNKLTHDFFNNINNVQNLKKIDDNNQRFSSNYSSISYVLLGLSGISLLLVSLTKGYSIYLTIILYIAGLISTIISIAKNPKSNTNKTLLVVYIIITIIIIIFMSAIIGWINSWKGVTS